MGPITRRNNSEIQQLRMGPPMKIRAQLVIGRWLAGEPYVPSARSPIPALSLDTCIVYARPPRALRAHLRAVTPYRRVQPRNT